MPPPNNFNGAFPPGANITPGPGGTFVPSPPLAALLVASRQAYDWPEGTGSVLSQATVIALEQGIAGFMGALTPFTAHSIALLVSRWFENNRSAHENILRYTAAHKAALQTAITLMGTPPATLATGLNGLCGLAGIALVAATKIYRFCYPAAGGSLDRHASYFFNSLPVVRGATPFATAFQREWSTAAHTTSRLAVYNPDGQNHNLMEFINAYIPTVAGISAALNAASITYACAATGIAKPWRPADVEMAAYSYWAATPGCPR